MEPQGVATLCHQVPAPSVAPTIAEPSGGPVPRKRRRDGKPSADDKLISAFERVASSIAPPSSSHTSLSDVEKALKYVRESMTVTAQVAAAKYFLKEKEAATVFLQLDEIARILFLADETDTPVDHLDAQDPSSK
jgi:hypothetical protein